MKNWESLPGWFDFMSLYEEVVGSYSGGVLVEVGTYVGKSLCCLGELVKKSGKPFHVVGIDTCLGSGVENGRDNHSTAVMEGHGTFAGTLHRNVIDCGLQDIVTLIVTDSVQASKLFVDKSVTMCFIDGMHTYDAVKRDIQAWLPKVKVGGILSGDDIGIPDEINPVWPDVKRAVSELLPDFQYHPHDSWIFKKR